MRIQHNIMAMNAYRNYTNNVSAMKSNLEKLSSGYKINRAGDDAAGLAISEKMRAQITGLQTAQKNAKDGISLVQTAEGALTEVHDMLNRMVELATQSANGTYDNDVDRVQLQKEMDQLKSEINRIADSANFNGIKLLDGSMNAEDIVTVKDPTFANQSAFDSYADLHSAAGPAGGIMEAQLHKDASGSSKTSFEIDLNDLSLTADENGDAKFTFSLTRPNGHEIAYYKEVSLSGLQPGEEVSAADLAAKIAEEIGENGANMNFTKDMASISNKGVVTNPATEAVTDLVVNYNVKADGTKLVFEMSDAGYKMAAANSDAVAKGETSFKVKDADDQERTIQAMTQTSKDPFQGHYSAFLQSENALNSTKNLAASNIVMGGTAAGKQLAQTLVDMKEVLGGNTAGTKVNDGAGIKVGDTSYVFAASDKTYNAQYGDNVKVVDIRDLVDEDGKFKADLDLTKELGGVSSAYERAVTRLTEAGADNKMFSLEQDCYGTLALTEKADYNGDGKDGRADLTTKDGIKEQIQKFSGVKANVDTIKATGKALTLQIGDTADSYNQLKVNIADMHAKSLGLDSISIADQDSAAAAVDAIKAAINKVSDVRGTLGATQNRLDHTINNLSVMTENIQDAESTIRDVDVAEEMMAYTKNNILIQSAQAMLAQANQVPQGVLQLLQ